MNLDGDIHPVERLHMGWRARASQSPYIGYMKKHIVFWPVKVTNGVYLFCFVLFLTIKILMSLFLILKALRKIIQAIIPLLK